MMSEHARQSRDQRSPFGLDIPFLVLALAFFIWTAFQTTALYAQRTSLATVRANQDQPLAELAKLQGAVEGLAGDTAKLAESGNATAKGIIEGFAKQGIKFSPPPAQH